jgi:hypothetical protein
MDKLSIQQINSLIRDQRWTSIVMFLDKFINETNQMEVKADTEFQTIWNVAYRQGKVEGLKDFFNQIEQL